MQLIQLLCNRVWLFSCRVQVVLCVLRYQLHLLRLLLRHLRRRKASNNQKPIFGRFFLLDHIPQCLILKHSIFVNVYPFEYLFLGFKQIKEIFNETFLFSQILLVLVQPFLFAVETSKAEDTVGYDEEKVEAEDEILITCIHPSYLIPHLNIHPLWEDKDIICGVVDVYFVHVVDPV